MLGARLILPGPCVDPESVLNLMATESVTIACGVPTVWMGVLEALEKILAAGNSTLPFALFVEVRRRLSKLIRHLDDFGLH